MADAMFAVEPPLPRRSTTCVDAALLPLMLEDVACALRPYGVKADDPQQLEDALTGLLNLARR